MILDTCKKVLQTHWLLTAGMILSIVGSIVLAVLPPVILARIVDTLSLSKAISVSAMFLYFFLFLFENVCISIRDSLLVVFGQKMSHTLRSTMMCFYITLDADTLNKQSPGAVVSGFMSDIDALEELFTSGIISLFVDACTLLSILVIMFQKAFGAFLVLLVVLPLIYLFTRAVQKAMLKNEIKNRNAVAKTNALLPETIHNLLMIQNLDAQSYMESIYDKAITESYTALQETNFFDAVYSPVILITNAIVTGTVILLCANPTVHISVFGMSAGTALMCMQYICKVFGPIESIGMEIQTIQSSLASIHRIHQFFTQPSQTTQYKQETHTGNSVISIKNVTFGYDEDTEVLHDFSLEIQKGEQVTLQGRTGAGKSTLFKLILGLYTPDNGTVQVFQQDPVTIPPLQRREIFGYVEQAFRPVKGTLLDQITLFDTTISMEQVQKACTLAGIEETITSLPQQFHTPYSPEILSQGQWQLVSIARAIVKDPPLLLLDEITASLDSSTEHQVLLALQNAMGNRTVLSISHRTTAITGRVVEILPAENTLKAQK